MSGESDVVECAFVESSVTDAAYFSTPLELGVSVLYGRAHPPLGHALLMYVAVTAVLL